MPAASNSGVTNSCSPRSVLRLSTASKRIRLKWKSTPGSVPVRLVFRNEAERWLVGDGAQEAYGVRFDGAALPEASRIVVNRDEMGGKLILDAATDSSLRGAPVEMKERSKKRKSSRSCA